MNQSAFAALFAQKLFALHADAAALMVVADHGGHASYHDAMSKVTGLVESCFPQLNDESQWAKGSPTIAIAQASQVPQLKLANPEE